MAKYKAVSRKQLEEKSNTIGNYKVMISYLGEVDVHIGMESNNHYDTIIEQLQKLGYQEDWIKEIKIDCRAFNFGVGQAYDRGDK